MTYDNNLIIFHAACSDGIVSAFCMHKKYPNAEFYAARYDSPIPDFSNKNVYIVDFSYPRTTMLEIKQKAASVVLLDHHKSAFESLSDLDFCHFDMNKSGAMLAWEYCFSEKAPWICEYTQDRDLFKFALPYSEEINSAMQSYPLTIDSIENLSNRDINDLIIEGSVILRANKNMVNTIVNKAKEVEIQGYKVLAVNSSVLQSDVGHLLANNRPFAAVWFENEDGKRIYSLRSSNDGGIDVSKIAAQYGGGGHFHSAAFRISGTP